MRYFISVLSLLFLIFNNAVAQQTVEETALEVVLGIDKIQRLNYVPSTQIQVGNKSVLSVIPVLKDAGNEIIIRGKKAGKTSVTIMENGTGETKDVFVVTVTESAHSQTVKELREFLGDVEGLEIGIKGDSVYVGGQIVVPSDIGKVVVILNRDKYKEVISLVELSPHTQKMIAKKMQDEIQANQMQGITVRVVNKLFWLEGVVQSASERQKAFMIAAAYLPENIQSLAARQNAVETVKKDIIQNFIAVNAKKKPRPIPKLVKVTAQFVELSKDYNKIFGFKWAPLLAGDGGAVTIGKGTDGSITSQSSGNTLTATISNLFPKLSTAKSAGHARIIQSGFVIVKNKIKGKISKNTTTPFAIGTGDFTKSETAVSGLDISVTPTILSGEKIDLSLGISVSSNIGDPPETISNNISTQIIVKSKESAAVGGIVINKTSTDYDRNPPYGQDEYENGTPLFNFLKSKSYSTSKNQFVVFITPELIESASEGSEEIKKKFRKRRR